MTTALIADTVWLIHRKVRKKNSFKTEEKAVYKITVGSYIIDEYGVYKMTVYCYCENCKYRSKRKSKAVNKAGQPMYKCLRKTIVIGDGTDLMGEHAECYTAEFPEKAE